MSAIVRGLSSSPSLFGGLEHVEAVPIHLLHPVVENRLDQTFAGVEMILDGMMVLLACSGGDLPQRYAVDPTASEQRFGSQNHLSPTVH